MVIWGLEHGSTVAVAAFVREAGRSNIVIEVMIRASDKRRTTR